MTTGMIHCKKLTKILMQTCVMNLILIVIVMASISLSY